MFYPVTLDVLQQVGILQMPIISVLICRIKILHIWSVGVFFFFFFWQVPANFVVKVLYILMLSFYNCFFVCVSPFFFLLIDLLNSLLSLSIDLLKVWHSYENHHFHKEQSVSGLATVQWCSECSASQSGGCWICLWQNVLSMLRFVQCCTRYLKCK